eukprot:scaffold400_cov188-Pinguiococcus_pyrenoidosus.AAC.2
MKLSSLLCLRLPEGTKLWAAADRCIACGRASGSKSDCDLPHSTGNASASASYVLRDYIQPTRRCAKTALGRQTPPPIYSIPAPPQPSSSSTSRRANRSTSVRDISVAR